MGKMILIGVTAVTAVVVVAVHYQQQRDRNEMRKGVLRDIERIEAKRNASAGKSEPNAWVLELIKCSIVSICICYEL